MSAIRFERSVRIHDEPAAVHALLSDGRRLITLQPFVQEVSEAEDGGYTVVERVPVFGRWAWNQTLHVRVASRPEDHSVFVRTRAPLGIRVRAEFSVQREAEATRVRERVEIECFALLRPFVRARAIEAQETLLETLAAIFRRTPAAETDPGDSQPF